MRFSLIQPELIRGDIDSNYKIIEKMIEKVSLENPHIIVLPEIRNTSSWDGDIKDIGDLSIDKAQNFISSLAKKTNSYIIAGSVMNEKDNKVYNTSLIYNNKGYKIASYDKVHLFNDEKDALESGNKMVSFDIEDIRCGIIICYDLDYPERIRKYALEGIELLFVPAAWEGERIAHYDILLKARAIENQIYVVGVNSVGLSKYGRFGGHSNIISPMAEEYVRVDNRNKIITIDIDLTSCDKYKKDFDLIRDRREDLY